MVNRLLSVIQAATSTSRMCLGVAAATLMLLLLSGCGSAREVTHAPARSQPGAHETLNATVWMQRSAEYRALALQAYNAALRMLDQALGDTAWTALPARSNTGLKPPAIIVDVDETVLDNSAFQARLIRGDTLYNRPMWNAWVEEERATAIPGAVRFLTTAAERGVTVFFVTNRSAELDEATAHNLVSQGFPVRKDRDVVLTRGERPEWTGDKSTRRDVVAEEFRVLFLAGDDLNDFVSTDDLDTTQRDSLVAMYASYWGERWIVLPNPTYGSWERVITSAANARSRGAQIRAKEEALRAE